jgi:hypothetical protein
MINAFGFSDAARRMCDSINIHVAALGEAASGQWVAIKLSDGGSDGVLYATRKEAIKHQVHEKQCLYVRIPPFGDMMTAKEAQALLNLNRSLYDAGYRLQDPADPAPINPLVNVAAPGRGAKLGYLWNGEWK